MLLLGIQDIMRHQLEAVLKIPHVVREKKELDIVPVCLVTLLILGIVISYVLFFPLEKERQERCQSPVLGRQRFMALSVFWVSSCPYKASGGSKGPTKLLTAGGVGEEEGGNAFSSGLCAGKEVRSIFPQLIELSSASCCGALSTHHSVLGDSLNPNLPLETLDVVDSRATVNVISSGKTFGVCLMLLLIPGSLVKSAFSPWGMGRRMGFSFFSDGSHEQKD